MFLAQLNIFNLNIERMHISPLKVNNLEKLKDLLSETLHKSNSQHENKN